MGGPLHRVGLSLGMLAALCACTGPQTTYTSPQETYTGTWYGPDGEPAERGQSRNYTYEVAARVGPDHCEWQSIVFLNVGWPLGKTVGVTLGSTWQDGRTYIRDAEGVLDTLEPWPPNEALDLAAVLPEQATPTGYRTGDVELWFGPDGGDRYAYLRTPDGVERWPRDTEGIACG